MLGLRVGEFIIYGTCRRIVYQTGQTVDAGEIIAYLSDLKFLHKVNDPNC